MKKLYIIYGLLFSFLMGCQSKSDPSKHAEDCNCEVLNIEQEDLLHRDSLSLSLDKLEDAAPYNFHENITFHSLGSEIYDTIRILSWGNVNMPDLIVLLTNDKIKRSHIVRLPGILAQHWVKDLNRDGNPELILFSVIKGEEHYGDLKVLEFDSTLGMHTYQLRDVEVEEHNGYHGHDNFTLVGDTIIRTFPQYLPKDNECCPSGGVDTVDYIWEIEDFFELIHQ